MGSVCPGGYGEAQGWAATEICNEFCIGRRKTGRQRRKSRHFAMGVAVLGLGVRLVCTTAISQGARRAPACCPTEIPIQGCGTGKLSARSIRSPQAKADRINDMTLSPMLARPEASSSSTSASKRSRRPRCWATVAGAISPALANP